MIDIAKEIEEASISYEQISRYTMSHPGTDELDALNAIKARYAKVDAKTEALLDAEARKAAELEELATLPITPELAKRVARKIANSTSKAKKSQLAGILGDKAFQKAMNPQTRDKAISEMSVADARQILGK